jgi:hypothetical protein
MAPLTPLLQHRRHVRVERDRGRLRRDDDGKPDHPAQIHPLTIAASTFEV